MNQWERRWEWRSRRGSKAKWSSWRGARWPSRRIRAGMPWRWRGSRSATGFRARRASGRRRRPWRRGWGTRPRACWARTPASAPPGRAAAASTTAPSGEHSSRHGLVLELDVDRSTGWSGRKWEEGGQGRAHLRDGRQRALEAPQMQLARREQIAPLRRAQRSKHCVALHLQYTWALYCTTRTVPENTANWVCTGSGVCTLDSTLVRIC